MKLAFFQIIWKTLILIENTFSYWRTYMFYALLITIISAGLGQWGLSCMTNQDKAWCFISMQDINFWSFFYILNLCLKIFIWLLFCYVLYEEMIHRQKMSFWEIKNFNKGSIYKIAALFISAFLFVVPIAAAFIIFTKKANPDWRIEAVWFLITFICCWLPFLVLRFSAGISYVLDKQELPPFKKIWVTTENNNFKIIFAFCLFLLIMNIFELRVSSFLKDFYKTYKNFVVAFGVEFLNNLVNLVIVSGFLMLTRALQLLILPENPSPQEAPAKPLPQKNDTAERKTEKTASGVKKTAKKSKSTKTKKNKKI